MEKNLKLVPQTVKPLGMVFTEQDNVVTGLRVAYDVNYGTSGGQVQPDIWSELNAQQKTLVQNIFDKLRDLGTEIVTESNK